MTGERHHHPWRAFSRLAHWTLEWAHLPEGLLGVTDFGRRTVTLTHGMTQVERRCTIAHETEHIHAGPVPPALVTREERRVDRVVSRRLIPLEALAEALVWANDEHELADELWVDVATVRARLRSLTDGESRTINERLDRAERGFTCADLR